MRSGPARPGRGVLRPCVRRRRVSDRARPEQRERLGELLKPHWVWLERPSPGYWQARVWNVTAEVRLTPVLPGCRVVTDGDGGSVRVVDLAQLYDDPGEIGGSVRAAAGRLLQRAG